MFGHKTAPINPKTINWSNARKMLETASNAGHTVSMINLAGFYMDGTKGVDIDHVKAHGLFLSVSYILLFINVKKYQTIFEQVDVQPSPYSIVIIVIILFLSLFFF